MPLAITLRRSISNFGRTVAQKGESAEIRNIYPDPEYMGEGTRYFATVWTRGGQVSSAVRLEHLGLTEAETEQLWQELCARLS